MYEDRTRDAIKSEILSELQTDIQVREGSFADDMSGPLAVQLYKMYVALNRVFGMVFVDESSGEFLDMTANELGIDPRKEGVKAVAELHIEGTHGTVVNAGKQFLTEKRLVFEADNGVVINELGFATVTATAAAVGDAYNVDAGEVCFQVENQSGIKSVSNHEAAQGGADPESGASLFARIDSHRKKPITSGNIYHYEKWALETQGVGAVKVFPLWAGPGTVKVLIANDDRQPVDDLTVRRCADYIEKSRPVGAQVTVESARGIPIGVSAQVRLKESSDAQQVAAKFEEGLKEYFGLIAFNEYIVRYNKIGAILMETPGVIDYRQLTVNGGESIELSELEVPILGEVTLSWI